MLDTILEQHKLWLQDNTKGQRADLRRTDLREADLWGADLWGTIGNNRELKTIQAGAYTISYTTDIIQIDCKKYSKEEWFNFTDEEISNMDSNALAWWKVWKSILKQILGAE